MAGTLLSMDPGTVSCGLAYFKDGKLVDATLVTGASKNVAERVLIISVGIGDWIENKEVLQFASEYPVKYPHDNIPPNDLIKLATIVGVGTMAVAHKLAELPVWYEPAQWKGQLSKTNVANIVRLRLDKTERAVLDACGWDHNVVEAAGIGLHHLKKFR